MEADTERLLLGKNGTSFHAFFLFLIFTITVGGRMD